MFFEIDERLLALSRQAEAEIRPVLERLDQTTEYNQQKMLRAFIDNRVSESHFAASTGYGYGDRGRDTLDAVLAQALGAQDALIRHNFVSGTHALTVALFGVLRPGQTMLCVTGAPYDTLQEVIGITGQGGGSLREWGVTYRQVELTAQGKPDLPAIREACRTADMVYIQRSRGYHLRPSLTVAEIGELASLVKEAHPGVIVAVDNCYGEFVEETEPCQAGADLIVGSLIKNPGGGIARTGGYIAGRHDLVEKCAYRLTTPGTGREIGATLNMNRELFMGLFHAPHVTGEALKTAVFAAALFEKLGYEVSPGVEEKRGDIIEIVRMGNERALVAFIQGMQKGAPVDSFVVPEPWDMPGYENQVIMAAGAFTLGASIELSADAPLREPYAAYMQGGVNYHSGKTGVLLGAQSMLEQNILVL